MKKKIYSKQERAAAAAGKEEKRAFLEKDADRAMERLMLALGQGRSEQFKAYLRFMTASNHHRYSAGNQFWLMFQCLERGIEPTVIKGFGQWAKEGYHVETGTGQKGLAILAPRPWSKVVAKKDGSGEEEEKRGMSFGLAFVFDASQLDADSRARLPQFFTPLLGDHEALYWRLHRVVRDAGIEVELRDARTMGGKQGWSQGGKIVQRDDLASANRFLNLVHEWSHEMLHQNPEGEKVNVHLKEIVAAVEWVVGLHYGIEGDFLPDYLLSHGITAEVLKRYLELVSTTAKTIIEAIEGVADKGEVAA